MELPASVTDLAATVAAIDLAYVRTVARLIERRDRIEADTGVTVDVWLANQTALPGWQRRALLQAADVLPHLPRVWQAWQDQLLTWEVVRDIVRTVARQARSNWPSADTVMANAAAEVANADPDLLGGILADWADQLDQARRARREARDERADVLFLEPRFDGTGGRLFGDYGAVGFAAISNAITGAAELPDDLAPNPDGEAEVTGHNRRSIGQANAAGLLKLCGTNADGTPKRPLLLATAPLSTFMGTGDDSARLLTTLTGGTLRVTATAARRLRDRFADLDLRLIVTDEDGATVGVGRTTRVPPASLRHAVLAKHPTCTFPGCNRPARTAQLDHAIEYDPVRGGGRTDADNLHPLCGLHHRLKTRATTAGNSWTVTVARDGTVTWRHPSGLEHVQPTLPKLRALARPAP